MGRSLPQNLANAGPQPPLSPATVLGLEVIQVVQDMNHTVPLITGKTTVVRCYIHLQQGANPIQVRGELTVTSGGNVTRVPSISTMSVDVLPADGLQSLREDLGRSLNFLLPPEVTLDGSVQVQLDSLTESSGAEVRIANGSENTVTVRFNRAPALRVKLFGLRYRTGGSAATFEPSELDFQLTVSWLKRVYPVSEVLVSRLIIDAPRNWPFSCNNANAQLAAIRRQDMSVGGDPRTHYYGVVSDGNGSNFMRGCASDVPDHPAPDTVASGPAGRADFGWDTDGSYADWYTGHELGHTFGRRHPGFCDQTSDDPNFPFPNGQLSNADGSFVGFDVGDAALGIPMRVLPGVAWADVMTYCDRQWMCSYTFEGILNRLREEAAISGEPLPLTEAVLQGPLPEDSAPSERTEPQAKAPVYPLAVAAGDSSVSVATKLVHVLAEVEVDEGMAKFVSVLPVLRGVPSREYPKSEAVVEFLGNDEKILSSHRIRVKESTCCEGKEHRHGLIDALLIVPDGAHAVRLLMRDKVVDYLSQGDAVRKFSAISPRLEVAAGPEADEELCTVQTSADGGETWETVAVNIPKREAKLDPRNYPGVSSVLMRVTSTDGFQVSSQVTSVNLE